MDVIDHRSWSPRGIDTTLVNEVYAKHNLDIKDEETSQEALDGLISKVKAALEELFANDENARVKVQRWFPGVVEEITEEVNEKTDANVTKRLMKEASAALDRKQMIQTNATKEKSVMELLGSGETGDAGDIEKGGNPPEGPVAGTGQPAAAAAASKPRRRVRHKTRSTPVVGGGLFGETIEAKSGREKRVSDLAKMKDMSFSTPKREGIPAEITVKGETFRIRINRETLRDLQKGADGGMTDARGIAISGVNISASDDAPVVQRLQGFVRNSMLQDIQEETKEECSETASDVPKNE